MIKFYKCPYNFISFQSRIKLNFRKHTMEEKYILCIPRGCGFNDVLCQIQEAYKFSQKSNRILLIDTRLSGLADSFSNYFELRFPNNRIKLDLSNEDLNYLGQLSCFPNEFEGKIDWIYHRFAAIESKKMYTWRHFNSIFTLFKLLKYVALNRISLKFSFIINYLQIRKKSFQIQFEDLINHPAQLIVHHMSGGGEQSIETLGLLSLKRDLRNAINRKINYLGNNYDSIHIRNTDYQTDYRTFLKRLKPKILNRRVLICTDNSDAMQDAKEILTQSEITYIEKYLSNKTPIHFQWRLTDETIQLNNINMLADLIGMAKSKNLFYSNLIENPHHARFSGFSTLAKNLKSRPELVNQLMEE